LAAILPLLPLTHAIKEDDTRTDKQHLNAAYRFLTRTRREAKTLRTKFLQELRERIANRKTPTDMAAKASLQCIEKQLHQTTQFRHIKHVLCPSTSSPLTKVHMTTTEQLIHPATGEITSHSAIEVVDTKAELEARILARNKKHFAQAQGTPFTENPLLVMTPAMDMTELFDAEGHPLQLPAETFKETITVLAILRNAFADRPPEIEATVSFDAFIASFFHWNEQTSTSPSGRHLGLYKSLVTAHFDSGREFQDCDDDGPSIKHKATAVLHAIHQIAAGTAQRGLYLTRWIFVVNAMIYKKAGVLELDELRVIHLFEADFNLLVGLIFGRRTVHNAVDHQLLHPSQFGKKGGECMDAAISKTLHNVLATYTKTPLGQFESDATACFDRIVMVFAMLCFFAYRCPTILIRFWLGALTHHCHQVKTSYGVSSGSYSFTADSRIHGPGQGSHGGPGSCVLATSVLLHALDKLANGVQFSDFAQSRRYLNCAAMFIGDNTSALNDFNKWLHLPPAPDQVVNLLAKDAQVWERLLPRVASSSYAHACTM
jgi:hypothetical protein